MSSILVIEDEPIIRAALKTLLEHQGHSTSECDSVDAAIVHLNTHATDLVITDVRLPGRPGTDLLEMKLDVPILVMTSYASLRSAVEVMKSGAVDYIAKPFSHDEMLKAVQEILARNGTPTAVDSTAPLRTSAAAHADIRQIMFGECQEMQRLFTLIHKVAPTNSTVLIQGESGTGKELAAKALHQLSRRCDARLISVNCAAIPENLIESELFGHEKGAFTGAVAMRSGLIEVADGGTLFLDEIGELPLEAQARLLRVLQEGEIRRVGSTQSRQVDVRLIAATHRNLRAMARTGDFREDLFYRLNVMPLHIPPLRDRKDDINGLAYKLLMRAGQTMGKAGLRFDRKCLEAIRQHDWPGNVRELENCIERAVILTEDKILTADLLGIDDEFGPGSPQAGSEQNAVQPVDLSLEDYFQHFVIENQNDMSETELARKLGISRKSLWERRQRLGIPRPRRTAK